ncbi:MAG: hypothetical protein ABI793_09230 [Flavobacterium sp.]
MKKIVFTVLAVIAFSSISMANNSSEIKTKVLEEKDIILFITDCENWAMDQMAQSDPQDQMPPEEAHDEYRYYVELCDSH